MVYIGYLGIHGTVTKVPSHPCHQSGGGVFLETHSATAVKTTPDSPTHGRPVGDAGEGILR